MTDDEFHKAVQVFLKAGLLPADGVFSYVKNHAGRRIAFDFMGAVTVNGVAFLLLRNDDQERVIVPIRALPEAVAAALPALNPVPAPESAAAS